MPSLVNKIVLDKKQSKIYLDDVEFEFHVKDNVQAVELTHGFKGLQVTIIAEEVEVIE